MDLSFFRRAIKELELGDCSVLKIGGLGEPTLHADFASMMRSLDSTPMQVLLYTNGTLFRQFTTDEICKWNIHRIVLSIDGLDAASFERQRKGGNFAEVRELAERFGKHKNDKKPIFEIRHVITPNESAAELNAFRKDWLQVADTVKFNYLIPVHPNAATVPTGVRCRDIRREIYIRWDGRLLLCAGQENQPTPEWLGDASQSTLSQLWVSSSLNRTSKGSFFSRRRITELLQKLRLPLKPLRLQRRHILASYKRRTYR
jgi:hypothetical protein